MTGPPGWAEDGTGHLELHIVAPAATFHYPSRRAAMPTPIVPASLAFAADGTPYSESFGDVYHSAEGGLAQARHVFLAGNGLPRRWRGRDRFAIAETGFGLGLNFLAAWQAWRDDPARPARLHFVAAELHPFRRDDLERLHGRWPELAAMSAELRAAWPPLTPGFHRLHFDDGGVTLTLLLGDAGECLASLRAQFDAFFLDGFAPDRNPDLWSGRLFRALARLAAPGATLATWTVAAAVREGLARAGFAVQKRQGFGRKREMLAGHFAGGDDRPRRPDRRVLVIGAGLAGCTAAERLAVRGWMVTLIERASGPGTGASGNLAGAIRPMLSRDDNIASRLSRACYLYALHRLHALARAGLPLRWSACGVAHVARHAIYERLQRACAEALGNVADYASFAERAALEEIAGRPLAAGGWFFPGGGWANPPSLCESLLACAGNRVRTAFGRTAGSIERHGDLWRVRDEGGEAIGEAPVAILANAAEALALVPAASLPLKRVRGQVTHLPASALAGLRAVVCREGYVTPPAGAAGCVGASFDFDDDPMPRVEGHAGNLERLERLLPGASVGLDPVALDGRVGFRTATPDRLPLAGALPDASSGSDLREAQLRDVPRFPGLFGLLGYGARGLVWAPLLAELLAAQLDGDPLPIEGDLVDALDPGRFLLRAHRRGRGYTRGSVEEDA